MPNVELICHLSHGWTTMEGIWSVLKEFEWIWYCMRREQMVLILCVGFGTLLLLVTPLGALSDMCRFNLSYFLFARSVNTLVPFNVFFPHIKHGNENEVVLIVDVKVLLLVVTSSDAALLCKFLYKMDQLRLQL